MEKPKQTIAYAKVCKNKGKAKKQTEEKTLEYTPNTSKKNIKNDLYESLINELDQGSTEYIAKLMKKQHPQNKQNQETKKMQKPKQHERTKSYADLLVRPNKNKVKVQPQGKVIISKENKNTVLREQRATHKKIGTSSSQPKFLSQTMSPKKATFHKKQKHNETFIESLDKYMQNLSVEEVDLSETETFNKKQAMSKKSDFLLTKHEKVQEIINMVLWKERSKHQRRELKYKGRIYQMAEEIRDLKQQLEGQRIEKRNMQNIIESCQSNLKQARLSCKRSSHRDLMHMARSQLLQGSFYEHPRKYSKGDHWNLTDTKSSFFEQTLKKQKRTSFKNKHESSLPFNIKRYFEDLAESDQEISN